MIGCLAVSSIDSRKNANDVVQDYLNELSSKGRPAARVGRPDSVAAQGNIAVSQNKTDSQGTAAEKPKRGRGRPRKSGNFRAVQQRGRSRQKTQHAVSSGACVSSGWQWAQLACLVFCVCVCV